MHTINIRYTHTHINIKNNARDTNYFTNCWCDERLLVNEKVILMVGRDKSQ